MSFKPMLRSGKSIRMGIDPSQSRWTIGIRKLKFEVARQECCIGILKHEAAELFVSVSEEKGSQRASFFRCLPGQKVMFRTRVSSDSRSDTWGVIVKKR